MNDSNEYLFLRKNSDQKILEKNKKENKICLKFSINYYKLTSNMSLIRKHRANKLYYKTYNLQNLLELISNLMMINVRKSYLIVIKIIAKIINKFDEKSD